MMALTRSLHHRPFAWLLGWLYALFAVGYVLGSVWLGRQAALHRRGWLIYGAMAMAAAGG